ncbi:PAS domain-containing protein [Chroococcidiopsis sp. FACHB-1243]|uniref:sensor histidine kinase n=1 Tax=Chroococcidiopsis sp. [FACHB-1243] TaxID=2692781 RepID=UPI0017854D77|nr:PAS domain-containing sensor histidine kinase [Chroococcidiopsis sp. [FACHB-1243]]MBD2307058.1 PAS domain-containing protein [Chroococcidiopsis sp. [FACHB-1243]]
MEQLKQAQQKFSILDQVPLGACILRSDLTILFWNSCLEEWTKLSRAEMLGTCIGDRYPHFHQTQYANRLQQIFQGGPPTIFSSQLHKHVIPASLPQGQMRIQHTTVTSLPALEGDEFYALLSIQDVTDLTFRVQEYRQMRDRALVAQETAEKANRVKDEFLAIVSHELRSPLNPILGWSRLLRTNQLNPATIDRALDTIERNAKLQAQLIEDLLDVSGILRGKLKLNWEIVDLANTITSALDTVVLAAEAKSIQIGLSLNPGVGLVRGDSSRLQQVVWNLLSNAVKFTPSGGQIEISLARVGSREQGVGSREQRSRGAEEQGRITTNYPLPITHYQLPTTNYQLPTTNYAQIQVSDTGKGISADFLPYIFEYFRQADSSMTRAYGGLGLGLAIARQLVELHGGTIWAESYGEGMGATLTVELPIYEGSSDQ